MAAAGPVVSISAAEGPTVVHTVSEDAGEHIVVLSPDLYAVVVELAEQVGIEVEEEWRTNAVRRAAWAVDAEHRFA